MIRFDLMRYGFYTGVEDTINTYDSLEKAISCADTMGGIDKSSEYFVKVDCSDSTIQEKIDFYCNYTGGKFEIGGQYPSNATYKIRVLGGDDIEAQTLNGLLEIIEADFKEWMM